MSKPDDTWQLLIERSVPNDPTVAVSIKDDILVAMLGFGCTRNCVDQVKETISENITTSFSNGNGSIHKFRAYVRRIINEMNPQPVAASWGIFIVQTTDRKTLITEVYLYQEAVI